jgi:CheY-like chemotaxis protein
MKRRIFVIDDEPDFTGMLKLSLESMGYYHVGEENNARDALASARLFDPDLILLDIMMPDLDGSEVASRVRGDPVLRDVPIVFLNRPGRRRRGPRRPLPKRRPHLPAQEQRNGQADRLHRAKAGTSGAGGIGPCSRIVLVLLFGLTNRAARRVADVKDSDDSGFLFNTEDDAMRAVDVLPKIYAERLAFAIIMAVVEAPGPLAATVLI